MNPVRSESEVIQTKVKFQLVLEWIRISFQHVLSIIFSIFHLIVIGNYLTQAHAGHYRAASDQIKMSKWDWYLHMTPIKLKR